jgi:hypothetical protein
MYAIKSAGLLGLLLGGAQLCAAAPADEGVTFVTIPTAVITAPTGGPMVPQLPTNVITAPGTPACTSVVNGVTKAPSCYVFTKTVTKGEFPPLPFLTFTLAFRRASLTHPTATGKAPTDLACPMYIAVTTKNVPCADSCCKTTRTRTTTKTVNAASCIIPTETVIRTTGCKTATPPILTLVN